MALQTVIEKLQYNNEKNVLIQGLPSSVEKQFVKLSFAKSVTPLLRTKKCIRSSKNDRKRCKGTSK